MGKDSMIDHLWAQKSHIRKMDSACDERARAVCAQDSPNIQAINTLRRCERFRVQCFLTVTMELAGVNTLC